MMLPKARTMSMAQEIQKGEVYAEIEILVRPRHPRAHLPLQPRPLVIRDLIDFQDTVVRRDTNIRGIVLREKGIQSVTNTTIEMMILEGKIGQVIARVTSPRDEKSPTTSINMVVIPQDHLTELGESEIEGRQRLMFSDDNN